MLRLLLNIKLDAPSAPSDLQPHCESGVFGNVYLLASDNTKRQTLPAPHYRNGSFIYVLARSPPGLHKAFRSHPQGVKN